MAIHAVKQPTPEKRMRLVEALRDLAPADNRLGGSRLDVSEPLGLYRLGLDDIDDPSSVEHAEFVGWRYLLDGGGHGTGMADVAQAGSEAPRFASLARNEQADFLLRAAHLAERIADDLSGDCEARILVIPSLYVSALWLTSNPPVFIPFLDATHPVRSIDAVAVRPDFLSDIVNRARTARGRRRGRPARIAPAP